MVFLSRRLFFAVLGGFILTVVAGTLYFLMRLREEVIASQMQMAELHARSLEDQLTQSLHVVDLSLSRVPGEKIDVSAALRLAPYIRSLSVLDRHGRILSSSNPENSGIIVPTEDFFPEQGDDILRIGSSRNGRDWNDRVGDGRLFIPAVREANGRLQMASLNPDYFINEFVHRVDDKTGVVQLLRYDGELLISTDEKMLPDGKQVWRERLLAREFDTIDNARLGQRDYILSYRASRTYPLVLVVCLDRSVILAGWRSEALVYSIVVFAVLLGIAGLSVFYYDRMAEAAEERKKAERQLRLSASVYEASQDAFLITDEKAAIISVNRAFTRITGYTEDEVLGKNPKVLASGVHSSEFYAAMWKDIIEKGYWQGEIVNRRKDGSTYPEWLSITTVRDHERITHFIANFADITVRKAAEEKIRYLAYYDTLTDLPNRRLLYDRLSQALSTAQRHSSYGALLFIDLDHFKNLNDTRGHDTGDSLLQQVALRLSTTIRVGDTVARIGGDEFVVLLEFLGENESLAARRAEKIAGKIRLAIGAPYLLDDREYHCTPSIGIALFTPQQTAAETLLKRADVAMYQAKSAGRNTVRFFDPEMQSLIERRVTLENELRDALHYKQFILHYQPQVDRNGRSVGVEALVRWQHPDGRIIPPSEFIELAEETGLIVSLGSWVLEAVVARLSEWANDPERSHLSIAVNVSARQFRQPDFVEIVSRLVEAAGIDASLLRLELTESLLLENMEEAIATMTALKKRGVSFSLDDFGTGYSSLAYLKVLPLDELKVDQSFVRDMLFDEKNAAIARAIVNLGQNLGVTVIAEGVETDAQWQFLIENGCHSFQGYLFGHPSEM